MKRVTLLEYFCTLRQVLRNSREREHAQVLEAQLGSAAAARELRKFADTSQAENFARSLIKARAEMGLSLGDSRKTFWQWMGIGPQRLSPEAATALYAEFLTLLTVHSNEPGQGRAEAMLALQAFDTKWATSMSPTRTRSRATPIR